MRRRNHESPRKRELTTEQAMKMMERAVPSPAKLPPPSWRWMLGKMPKTTEMQPKKIRVNRAPQLEHVKAS